MKFVFTQCKAAMLFCLLMLYCGIAYGQSAPSFVIGNDPKPIDKKWMKVNDMSDEFDKEFNDSRWHREPVENGWNWLGRWPALFQKESTKVKNGELQTTVNVLENPIPKGDGKNWLYSGGITRSYSSRGVGTYFECSMKANQTEMSSTFWLKPRPTCKKNLELDIQECVGVMSPDATAKLKWDNIYHSNMFNFRNENCSEIPDSHLQDWKILDEKNSDRFFTYGCYLESSTKAHFYLDGVYQYTMTAERPFDEPMHIVLAIETYDWNMPPKGGGMIANGDFNERTTRYDWIRTWELIDNSNGMVNNESQETILFPIEDAYIGNDKCYDNSNLRVEHSEKQKISYLKFNLSDVSGKISSAKLRLTSTTYGKGVFNVHLANKTDWKETTLDNSNKPIATKILGAYKGKVKNGEAYSWELDATAIENLNELNMIISQLDTDDKNNAQFASKENSNTAALPQLVLTLGNNETTTTDNNYSFIIEAENFNKTGGNFDDNNAGGPGYGVLRNSKTISHVNNEDWVEYTANVKSAGTYKIEYLVATPSDNANIQLSIDGAEVLNTKISNMYTWDNMKWINGKETVYISKGKHNFNIKAVGSTWQWNLDKIKLIHTSQNKLDLSTKSDENEVLKIYPNPVNVLGGNFNIDLSNSLNINFITIYTINGKIIYQQEVDEDKINLNSNIFPSPGIYFVNASDMDNRIFKSLKISVR